MKPQEDPKARAEAMAEDFDELYAQWNERVYRYIVHLIGPGAEAEDLFQDTWMKVVEQFETLRDRSRFGPWAMRIARNLTFNRMRERKRKTQVWMVSQLGREDIEGDDLIHREPDRRPDPRGSLSQLQRAALLAEALDTLDEDSREMVHLRYFEHMRLAEISEMLEVPLGTVCVKVQRALKKVRLSLVERGIEHHSDL